MQQRAEKPNLHGVSRWNVKIQDFGRRSSLTPLATLRRQVRAASVAPSSPSLLAAIEPALSEVPQTPTSNTLVYSRPSPRSSNPRTCYNNLDRHRPLVPTRALRHVLLDPAQEHLDPGPKLRLAPRTTLDPSLSVDLLLVAELLDLGLGEARALDRRGYCYRCWCGRRLRCRSGGGRRLRGARRRCGTSFPLGGCWYVHARLRVVLLASVATVVAVLLSVVVPLAERAAIRAGAVREDAAVAVTLRLEVLVVLLLDLRLVDQRVLDLFRCVRGAVSDEGRSLRYGRGDALWPV